MNKGKITLMAVTGIIIFILIIVLANSCSRVEPNYEGVLMTNYGRNGKDDFKSVAGRQNTLLPGTTLYQVPMFEQKGDPTSVVITAKDAGVFSVDPTYTYQPVRGRGIDIIFNYKHVGVAEPNVMMDNIENAVLNQLVINAYREEARNYTTDSLMNNLNAFEQNVEHRLLSDFQKKFFALNNLTSGLKPPESMAHAIEARNNAIQQAEQVKNELQVSQMNLEKAKIDAEANRVRAAGLDAKVLQEKWIEAIRNTDNKVIITDGRTPVILGQ
jgi:regulator of protease activity HflC (stomatin/prohibitin superfamily)